MSGHLTLVVSHACRHSDDARHVGDAEHPDTDDRKRHLVLREVDPMPQRPHDAEIPLDGDGDQVVGGREQEAAQEERRHPQAAEDFCIAGRPGRYVGRVCCRHTPCAYAPRTRLRATYRWRFG